MRILSWFHPLLVLSVLLVPTPWLQAQQSAARVEPKKIVLLAGPKDKGHPAGTHEYEKAVRLLNYCLQYASNAGPIRTEMHFNGWPEVPATLEDADTIVLIASGSNRNAQDHPFLVGDRLKVIEKQMKRGCGLVVIHWATFAPKARAGEQMLEWIGGYFDYESGPAKNGWYSKIKTATSKVVPAAEHPIGRGLTPFELKEEFYYNIRFREQDRRLTPILRTVIPGESAEQVVAWAVERQEGGRGFGFTGGHFFDNWKDDHFRRLVLNAIIWTARAEVPREGVSSPVPPESALTSPEKPIRTLILTGHDGPFHNWRLTSQALKAALEADARFQVRIVTDPEFLASNDLFNYDLLVQNYVNWERGGLSEKARQNFVKFLEEGKGLAVIHFANGAFHFSLPKAAESDWPEYRKIVRRVWDHTKGKSAHDPYGPFTVEVAPKSTHPIVAGMKPFETNDELYFNQAGEDFAEPLVMARSKVTKKYEPLAWAYGYGRARIFQTVLGHAAESIRKEGPALLIRRGCLWAAKQSLEPETASPVKLTDGKFGKALDARIGPALVEGKTAWRSPPLTVECWTKLFSKSSFNILVSSDPKTSSQHWELYSYVKSGHFSVYLPGYQPAEIVSSVDIADGKWHHVAMTFDTRKVILYVDGKAVHSQAVVPAKEGKAIPGPLAVGQADTGNGSRIGCDGLIDDLRLSSTIRVIHAVPTKELAYDEGTLALLPFDKDEGLAGDPAWTPPPLQGKVEPWQRETDKDWIDTRLQKMQTGRTWNATFTYPQGKTNVRVFKGTAIRIGAKQEAAVLFDRNQFRFAAAWTGNFLNHSSRRFGLLNTPTPAGSLLWTTPSVAGWANPQGAWDHLHPATAPLPAEWARFKGMYRSGEHTVLAYTVHGVEVFESPWFQTLADSPCFERFLDVGPAQKSLQVLLGEFPSEAKKLERINGYACVVAGQRFVIAVDGDEKQYPLSFLPGNRLVATIPAGAHPRRLVVRLLQGPAEKAPMQEEALRQQVRGKSGLDVWKKPASSPWPTLSTKGTLGTGDGPLVVDTLTIPYENPFNALFFVSGVDFLPGNRVAVCTAHGDVWIVEGADNTLVNLTWRRFSTGHYQPLGLKVVEGKIVIIERGQLTRLHDLNNDGYADYLESITGDWHTGAGEHSFDTCLETDPEGNYYFFKTGDTDTPTGGCLLKAANDGSKVEIFSTGFRHPIGLGMSPKGMVTGADQQGNWIPSTRLDVFKQGGFYGDMRAHHRKEPPTTYDLPLCWIPHFVDNSAGGQVWVPEGKWGSLSGQMLHMSYGRCRIFPVLMEPIEGGWQGGIVDSGLFFLSGVCRGRFHPNEDHLYVAGLRGWQNAATKDGCLQRVRYTGKPIRLPTKLAVVPGGLQITFPEAIDPKALEDLSKFRVEAWNYRWSAEYGSKDWLLSNPNRQGHDILKIESARLEKDGKTVTLQIANLQPAMQVQTTYQLRSSSGDRLEGTIWHTIHKVPLK